MNYGAVNVNTIGSSYTPCRLLASAKSASQVVLNQADAAPVFVAPAPDVKVTSELVIAV